MTSGSCGECATHTFNDNGFVLYIVVVRASGWHAVRDRDHVFMSNS